MSELPPIPRRSKESELDHQRRVARWHTWRRQEPCVDLWYVDDIEAAEYRAWAGTTGHHRRIVDELIAIGRVAAGHRFRITCLTDKRCSAEIVAPDATAAVARWRDQLDPLGFSAAEWAALGDNLLVEQL